MAEGSYQYAKLNNTYFIKLSGNLRYTISMGFKSFISQLMQQDDYDKVLVDLSDASFIDSTNLGLIAQLANHMISKFSQKLTIVSTNEDITELLRNLGFQEIAYIVEQPHKIAQSLAEIPTQEKVNIDTVKMLLEAHQQLMQMNKQNKIKFKNVVEMLKKRQDRADSE